MIDDISVKPPFFTPITATPLYSPPPLFPLTPRPTEKVDYAEAERIITFDESYTTASEPECVRVPIFDDDILEDQETYIMEIVKTDLNIDYELLPFTVRCVIDDNDSEWSTRECGSIIIRATQFRICY